LPRRIEDSHEKPQTVSGPRFEACISGEGSRKANHSAAKFGDSNYVIVRKTVDKLAAELNLICSAQ
jgi:hypothetical protein